MNQLKIIEHKDVSPARWVNMAKPKAVPLPLLKSSDADVLNAACVDRSCQVMKVRSQSTLSSLSAVLSITVSLTELRVIPSGIPHISAHLVAFTNYENFIVV